MSEKKEEKRPEDLFILEGISYVSFNKDFSQVALSKKNKKIYIYSVPTLLKTDTWKLLHTLENHQQYVSGLDWSPKTNKILSCSHDKTAYVWNYEKDAWNPSNVVATTKLGYLTCKWNNRGDKFCAGTSAKNLFIGYYNEESKWWMGVNIKAHKSSVICCEIDPMSLFVISGSTDCRIYVSSCYLPEIDDKFLNNDSKKFAQKFGSIIYEFKPNAWVNSVSWNVNGNLAFAASQNSTVAVIDYKNNKTDFIKLKHSPPNMILSGGEKSFYAICYDRNIYEYQLVDGNWVNTKRITEKKDGKSDKNVAKDAPAKNAQGKKEALVVKMNKDPNVHPALILSVSVKGKDVVTTDVAGFVKFWKLS